MGDSIILGHRYEVLPACSLERDDIAVQVWDAEDPEESTLFGPRSDTEPTITTWIERDAAELLLRAHELPTSGSTAGRRTRS